MLPLNGRSCSHKFFRHFLKISQNYRRISSKIVAPPSDTVEISADSWKARFCCKKQWKVHWNRSKNGDIICCWLSGPLPGHPVWQTYKQKTPLFFISCRHVSTDLHQALHACRTSFPFLHPSNIVWSDPQFLSQRPQKFRLKLTIEVFCL